MGAETVRFVPAREEDAALLSRLRRRMWETTYRGIYPDEVIDDYDYALHESRDLARLRDPTCEVFRIIDGEESVGYFCLHFGETLYIQSLYLLPEYRRQGLGRRIFAYIRERAAKQGRDSFRCNCNAHNTPALAFYRAMGGRITAEDTGHVNWQEDQIGFVFPVNE